MARNKDVNSGRNYVFRLIKFRMRSELEIRNKLRSKHYDTAIIEELISYFKDLGYINDREFARSWISNRLNKPLGLKVIRWELKEKGLDQDIIDELLHEKKSTLNESAMVEELARRQLDRLKRKKEPADKIKQKLYYYLARRGFSGDTVMEIVNRRCNDA